MIGDLDYIYACDNFLFPLISDFKPEVILISCGFDSALGDDIGGVGITPAGYAWMTYGLMKICPHTISLLEGGYDLESLAKCSEAVLRTMMLHAEDDIGFS
jgi:histone deacetylase 6